MKMNKKGFTLIEMLVVIAIIAVLVAIVVPTVSSATTKANAATNAANLRSYAAEVAIYYLTPGEATVAVDSTTGEISITTTTGEGAGATTTNTLNAPESKKVGQYFEAGEIAKAFLQNGEVVVAFADSYTEGVADIDFFAYIAENGEPKAAE